MERLLQNELKAIGDDDFKPEQNNIDKFGYDFSEGRSVPCNVTPGEVSIVYTPKNPKLK